MSVCGMRMLLVQVTDTVFELTPKMDIKVIGTLAEALPVTSPPEPEKVGVMPDVPNDEFLKFAVKTCFAIFSTAVVQVPLLMVLRPANAPASQAACNPMRTA